MPADLNDYFNKKKPGNDNRGSGQNNDKEPPFKKDFKIPNIPSGFGKFGALAYIIIAIIAILAITQPFKVIHSGEVGIKATAGKYEPNPLQPGFHFFLPFIQNIIVVDTRVRIINYTSGEDMGESLQKSYQGAGILRKNSISVLDARNLPVSIDIELLTVQLREIILPSKVKEQIERVQIAKQEAERTKYEVERANQEALKQAALAEGSAKAAIIEAKGKADAIKIEADATAYANKEIAKSVDQNLLNLKQIETQNRFNDALKENKDAKIFLTPGGAVPNIWLDAKDRAKASSVSER